MIEVVLISEGQTEETFARDVLAPALWERSIFVHPRLIPTSTAARGGALSWPRVKRSLRNTLRERGETYVTTFFDLYRLDAEFPGWAEAASIRDPVGRAEAIEARLGPAIVAEAECRPDRFLPHIQPYEFESLLFSDIDVFPKVNSEWQAFLEPLRRARGAAQSPEHIDDGADSHPSARLEILRPRFEKVLHGPRVARRIGIGRIREVCTHFGAWLSRIESLAARELGE